MSREHRLDADELENRLDSCLEAVISLRRSAAEPARRIALLDRGAQEFVLDWIRSIASTNTELAYHFANHATRAVQAMDISDVEAWVVTILDTYDKQGLVHGVKSLQEVDTYVADRQRRRTGLGLDEIKGLLEHFLRGLSGRTLRVEATDGPPYTDTEKLFLPALLDRFDTREDNLLLYKAMAVHQWAQTWFGTWRVRHSTRIGSCHDPKRALDTLHTLERLRLDARVATELPGLYRRITARLFTPLPGAAWRESAARLSHPDTTVETSYELLPLVLDQPAVPCCYQGMLALDRTESVIAGRIEQDRRVFARAVVKLERDFKSKIAPAEDPLAPPATFEARPAPDSKTSDGVAFELLFDGRVVNPSVNLADTMRSIVQDFGNVPPEYLVAAGQGAYALPAPRGAARSAADVWKGTYHEHGAFLYDEWDHKRGHFRKRWCVVREIGVHPRDDEFADETLSRYGGLLKHLRRSFEALREESKQLKRQSFGDDIDFDALVESYTDSRLGLEPDERIFTHRRRHERDIAAAIMVDMSGSTKGWINDAEREALVLLSESLNTLGDRFAIYGFSGITRKRCDIYRVKSFDQTYDADIRARISGIRPQDYTRMGASIRHLTHIVGDVDARTRLLIALSDGRPDDYDQYYRGAYGIEDTRMALYEARCRGIHPFCITIDDEAPSYLPRMYGHANFVVLNDVRKLPTKVSDIYRRLTS